MRKGGREREIDKGIKREAKSEKERGKDREREKMRERKLRR